MKILFTEHFKKQLKQLTKKHPNIKEDLLDKLRILDLKKEIYIGKAIYKVRIKSSDLNKGKSGGSRSYVYFYKTDSLVPLCIYLKSDREALTSLELQKHFESTIDELFTKFRTF